MDGPAAMPWIGRRVGAWRLEALIARGGMGEVYRGERADGQVEQRVAVKVMRGGFNLGWLLARFTAERQILASLDHPNLAKVLDGGITTEGVPWFAMELVEGEPIDAHAERTGAGIDQRLQLFRSVCQVVDYAHSKGVVHRDLKASNILVTRDGMVKLVDFGIAKRMASADDHGTPAQTVAALQAMTLEYCSPEQLRGGEVGPASDIYSLGVVLYRLLARCSPYRGAVGSYQLAAAICETLPPAPSTVAEPADGDRRAWRRRLRGDLDAVVMKALSKAPAERYASAMQIADDLFRHLEHLPVQARPRAWPYRAQRFLLRHRTWVLGALAANLALAAGLALAAYQTWRADRYRERAEHHLHDVRTLANVLLFDVHDSIRSLPGSTPARKLVVDKALAYLNTLGAEAERDPMLRVEIASGYRKVGDILGRPAVANLGDSVAALENYRRAHAMLAALVADAGLPAAVRDAARWELGTLCQREGSVLNVIGRFKQATEVLQEGLASTAALVERDPSPRHRFLLATLYQAQAQVHLFSEQAPAYLAASEQAGRLLEELVAAAPGDDDMRRELAAHYISRGEYLRSLDEAQAVRRALEPLSRAEGILRPLQALRPNDALLSFRLAITRLNIGNCLQRLGETQQAIGVLRETAALFKDLSRRDPSSVPFKVDSAATAIELSEALRTAHDIEGSLRAASEAIGLIESLPQVNRAELYTRYRLVQAQVQLARALEQRAAARREDHAGARADIAEACARYRQVRPELQDLSASGSLSSSELHPADIDRALQRCPAGAG